MADKKPTVNKEQIKTEESKAEDITKVKKVYTIIKNVKYGNRHYKIGNKVELTDKEVEIFKVAGTIRID
jgi:hypothetical protein